MWQRLPSVLLRGVFERSDAELPLLGMLSYDKKDKQSIRKAETSVAKNYLNEEEMKLLGFWLSSIWLLQKRWHNNKRQCI